MRTKTMLRAAALATAGALVLGGVGGVIASATSWSPSLPGISAGSQDVELLARPIGIKWWK